MGHTPVVALVNGGAKGLATEAARRALAERLAATGAEVIFPRNGEDVTRLARAQREAGAHMVIAAGGDGTVGAVAGALAGSGTILGVLPLGALNHFAKDLGIPTDIDGAVKVLSAGTVTTVDAAQVNGRIFVNNSGLGLYPAALTVRDEQRARGWRKWPALIWGALHALARYRLMTIRVSTDAGDMVRTTPMVFIGNDHYTMHGFRLGSRAGISGGNLCMAIPHRTGRFRLTWFSIRALLGRRFPDHALDHVHAERVRIDAGNHRVRVSLDGELTRLRTPLDYQILRGALRVAVPKAAEAVA